MIENSENFKFLENSENLKNSENKYYYVCQSFLKISHGREKVRKFCLSENSFGEI
jgi:hypothetical protein